MNFKPEKVELRVMTARFVSHVDDLCFLFFQVKVGLFEPLLDQLFHGSDFCLSSTDDDEVIGVAKQF